MKFTTEAAIFVNLESAATMYPACFRFLLGSIVLHSIAAIAWARWCEMIEFS